MYGLRLENKGDHMGTGEDVGTGNDRLGPVADPETQTRVPVHRGRSEADRK